MRRFGAHAGAVDEQYAATLIQTKNETFDMHSYLQAVKAADGNEEFTGHVKEYSEKYSLPTA